MAAKKVRKNRHLKKIEKIIGSPLVYIKGSKETEGASWVSEDFTLVVHEIDDDILASRLSDPKGSPIEQQLIAENYNIAKSQGAKYIISFNMDGGPVQSYLESVRRFAVEGVPFILHKGHFVSDGEIHFLFGEPTGIFLFEEAGTYKDFKYLKEKFEGYIKKKLSFSESMKYVISSLAGITRGEERKKYNAKKGIQTN